MRILIWVTALTVSALMSAAAPALASEGQTPGHDHEKCPELFNIQGPTVTLPSGRDEDIYPELQQASQIIFGENGIARKLGLATPPQTAEFMPSSELSTLATLARHPVPHWYDGAQVLGGLRRSLGVLEFVTPGCPTCRSYYSDNTKREWQISILMHVAGHNDFAAHSMYNRARGNDPIAESLKLASLMRDLYEKYDHDEVARWYQYLSSFTYLQDLVRGSFDSPEELLKQVTGPEFPTRINHALENPYAVSHGGRINSPSVLSALVAHLPSDTPYWKREMALTFERMVRTIGYYVQTKIMNEGWATLMQEMIAAYSPWNDSHHGIEFGQLLSGVAVPDLGNPYWLGREAWRNLRRKFFARPEIQGLPRLEQDRKFIEYAHREFIDTGNDYTFLRAALDDRWVYENKLFINRPAQGQEYDWSIPRQSEEDQEQKIIVSRNPKKIIDFLATALGDRRYGIPRIFIDNLNGGGRGIISLRHEVFDDMPLERGSAAQTLYVISQVMSRPVSLMTIRSSAWEEVPKQDGWAGGNFVIWGRPIQPERPKSFPIRIEVQPNGIIQVFDRASEEPGAKESLNEKLTTELQAAIQFYKDDSMISESESLNEFDRKRFAPMVSQVASSAVPSTGALFSHSPTAADALYEYTQLIQSRTVQMIRLAVQGKIKLRQGKSGVIIRVLPIVPSFDFDRKVTKKIRASEPPMPVDNLSTPLPMLEVQPIAAKEDIGSGGGKPGDKYWGPGGQGDGDGDGDEEGDGDDQGGKPGKGSLEPGEIEVPLALYGQILAEELQLPNLKRTDGETSDIDTEREGGIHRPYGDILWDRTVEQALAYGKLDFERSHEPDEFPEMGDLIRRGLKFLQPSDYVVAATEPVPTPDINAVIVYALDMTGSMGGRRQELAKEVIFNINALLAANYPKLEKRFVGFDTRAYEFPESEIFKKFLGGGTMYSSGLEKAEEILNEPRYPTANWNKYVVTIGDLETGDTQETSDAIDRLYQQTRFMGVIETAVPQDYAPEAFKQMLNGHQGSKEWFRFVQMQDTPQSSIDAIRGLFGKSQSK